MTVSRNLGAYLLGLVLWGGAAGAQSTPQDLPGLVTSDWEILRQAQGDLNGDGRADMALVLRGTDLKLRKDCDPLVGESLMDPGTGKLRSILNTNPRRLVVLLGSPEGWKEVTDSRSLLSPPDFTFGETLDYLRIEDGALNLGNMYMQRHHGEVVSRLSYRFRFQAGHMELCSARKTVTLRSESVWETRSYDFPTATVTITRESLPEGEALPEQTRAFSSPGPVPLEQVAPSWEIEPGFWL